MLSVIPKSYKSHKYKMVILSHKILKGTISSKQLLFITYSLFVFII